MLFLNFEENLSAKTPSFFSKDYGCIYAKQMQDLKEFALSNNTTARLNLFPSPQDELHFMLIFHPRKFEIPCQNFKNRHTIYMLIDGEFKLILFTEDLQIKEEFHLSKTGILVARIPKNTPYKLIMISDELMFVEIRNGAHIKKDLGKK